MKLELAIHLVGECERVGVSAETSGPQQNSTGRTGFQGSSRTEQSTIREGG